jgi:hypothetical protein
VLEKKRNAKASGDEPRHIRKRVLAFLRSCARKGVRVTVAAAQLWLKAATLRAWLKRWAKRWLRSARRGRPAQRGTAVQRAWAWGLIDRLGPFMGAEELWRRCSGISRREAKRLLDEYRRRYRERRRRIEYRLTWHRWGAVWAVDFTRAPCVVAGVSRYLVAVRDVAGREALTAQPVHAESACEALSVLHALFERHGAPLVLKMDNGSAFIAEAMQAFLEAHDVVPLYSPPRLPEYNGCVEAGNTWLKLDAQWSAMRHSRADAWAEEDLQHALARSLDRAALRKRSRPLDRTPITAEERAEFLRELAGSRAAWQRRLELADYETLNRLDKAKLDRKAVPAALEQMQYLTVTRRRVTPPIKRKIA